jgi:hypothetical protein
VINFHAHGITALGMAQAQMAIALYEIGEREMASKYQQQVYEDFAGPFLAVTELSSDLGCASPCLLTSTKTTFHHCRNCFDYQRHQY